MRATDAVGVADRQDHFVFGALQQAREVVEHRLAFRLQHRLVEVEQRVGREVDFLRQQLGRRFFLRLRAWALPASAPAPAWRGGAGFLTRSGSALRQRRAPASSRWCARRTVPPTAGHDITVLVDQVTLVLGVCRCRRSAMRRKRGKCRKRGSLRSRGSCSLLRSRHAACLERAT